MINNLFLGGTCGKSTWRSKVTELIELEVPSCTSYYNPQLPNLNYNKSDYLKELIVKKKCDVHLYVITSESPSIYSIAEAVESTLKNYTVVVQIIPNGFSDTELKSLENFKDLIARNGGYVLSSENLQDCVNILKSI